MSKKLLDVVRDKIRYKHYSLQTEKSYLSWIQRYVLFHISKKEVMDDLKSAADKNISFWVVKGFCIRLV